MTSFAPSRPPSPRWRRRGLSLAELLVVLAIIATVVVIAIPTVTQQVERAKISSARADVRAIAQAQDSCAAYFGFYVPLRVLDDLPDPNVGGSVEADSVDQEVQNDVFLIDSLQTPSDLVTTQLSFSDSGTNARANDIRFNWTGPFLDPQRVAFGPNPENQSELSRDFVLDPWGYPYRFFSAEGVIGSSASQTNLSITDFASLGTAFDNGRLTTTRSEYNNTGRYVIVSLGRDLDYDSSTDDEMGDDIWYAFGLAGFESAFQTRFPF